jgi:hydroxymethylpyrimidine pyrophosphatase-like HAD family hydrolase
MKNDEVVAFGDMLNDVVMLQFAGSSYAMANAEPEVKAVAKYTTLSNKDEGVASAIEALLELPN